jgi:hypothetical protein
MDRSRVSAERLSGRFMADYHSLLMRAVANLPSAGTPATREAIYVRARKALIEQLRSLRPPLPESDIAREANALDAAIAQIEAKYGPQHAAQSAAPSPPASASPAEGQPGAAAPPSPKPAQPIAAPQSAAFQRPAPPGSPQISPMAGSPATPASPPRPPSQAGPPSPLGSASGAFRQPSVPLRPPQMPPPRTQPASSATYAPAAPREKPTTAPPPAAASPSRPQPAVTVAKPPPSPGAKDAAAAFVKGVKDARDDNVPPPHDLAKAARSARVDEVHASAAPPVVATRPDEPVQSAAAPEVPGEFDRPGAGARQDFEGQRPVAPILDDGKPKPWLWIAAAVVLGVVLAVAGAAILMRQKPQDLAIKPPVEAAEPPAAAPPAKTAERVAAAPSTPAAPPAPASEPKADQSAAQGAAPAAPAAQPQSPPAAPAPSAGRAAMLVASADNPEKPVVSLGSTVWSLIPAASGQPATVAVKAEADIPDLKMHATMTLRKNTDPTLQATHTIDLKFSFAEGAPITGFKDVGLPQMRMEDSTAAEALTSVKVKISDTYFLIALAKSDSDTARNLDLMQTRSWFDFPLLLNDDRIAKVVFQKSAEGQAMLEKAFEAWK